MVEREKIYREILKVKIMSLYTKNPLLQLTEGVGVLKGGIIGTVGMAIVSRHKESIVII